MPSTTSYMVMPVKAARTCQKIVDIRWRVCNLAKCYQKIPWRSVTYLSFLRVLYGYISLVECLPDNTWLLRSAERCVFNQNLEITTELTFDWLIWKVVDMFKRVGIPSICKLLRVLWLLKSGVRSTVIFQSWGIIGPKNCQYQRPHGVSHFQNHQYHANKHHHYKVRFQEGWSSHRKHGEYYIVLLGREFVFDAIAEVWTS